MSPCIVIKIRSAFHGLHIGTIENQELKMTAGSQPEFNTGIGSFPAHYIALLPCSAARCVDPRFECERAACVSRKVWNDNMIICSIKIESSTVRETASIAF